MAREKLFYVGIKALVTNSDGKFLLLRTISLPYSPAHWDIPGGRIQEGHTVLETLQREIFEETGVDEVSDAKFCTAVIANIEIPLSETEQAGLLLMVYTAKLPEKTSITLSEEHTAYEWVDRKEAAARLGYRYPQEFTSALLGGGAGGL